MNEAFKQLKTYLDEAMAIQTALVLFEWDDATLAPKAAGTNTSKVIEILSGQYFKAMTGDETKALVKQCLENPEGLNEAESAQVKEMEEVYGYETSSDFGSNENNNKQCGKTRYGDVDSAYPCCGILPCIYGRR